MRELGPAAQAAHRDTGRLAADLGIDVLVTVGHMDALAMYGMFRSMTEQGQVEDGRHDATNGEQATRRGMLMPDSETFAEPTCGGAEFPGRRPRRDTIWFVPTVVAGVGVAIPGTLTMLIAGVLYTFGMDSCGPGSGSGKPCPNPVKAPQPALWSAALALCLLTLVLPRQTRFRVPRWLLAAGAVALGWLGLDVVGGQWPS